MKRALVTGSAGFVGAHMVNALTARGYAVATVDVVHGQDCRNFFRYPMTPTHYDLVVHCAAVVGGRTMIDGEPLKLAAEDLSIDAELFRWALRARPGRIVYFSSSAAYPVRLQTVQSGGRRLQEGDVVPGQSGAPDQTYGWVKLTGERLAAEANAVGIPTFVFRPFSGYGPGQVDAYPFPAIAARAAARENPIPIWANTVRDFVHIGDVVGAVFAALDADARGPLNICTGVPTSFAYLARLMAREVGYQPRVHVLSDKPTGVQYRVGDPTAMEAIYRPKVTIEQGVAEAIRALI